MGDGLARDAKKPDVVWLPTPVVVVEEMLALAGVGPEDVLYDLGSGDGRTVVTAAKRFGVGRAVGVEMRSHLLRRSRKVARRAGVRGKVRFVRENLFETDLAGATVVTLYLLPRLNLKIRLRLLRTLPPGTRIVSHDFGMDDWDPDRTVKLSAPFGGEDGFVVDHKLHLWVVPADAARRWRWSLHGEVGARTFELELGQRFQKVHGTLLADGLRYPIRKAKLGGDRIGFTVRKVPGLGAKARFDGRVIGDSITGTLEIRGGPANAGHGWPAERVALQPGRRA